MILPVFINNCIVLFVKVNALFILNEEPVLITSNKQPNTTFVHLRQTFYFTRHHSLVRKSVLISMTLRLSSVNRTDLFRSLVKISWSLSHFGIIIANKEEGIS